MPRPRWAWRCARSSRRLCAIRWRAVSGMTRAAIRVAAGRCAGRTRGRRSAPASTAREQGRRCREGAAGGGEGGAVGAHAGKCAAQRHAPNRPGQREGRVSAQETSTPCVTAPPSRPSRARLIEVFWGLFSKKNVLLEGRNRRAFESAAASWRHGWGGASRVGEVQRVAEMVEVAAKAGEELLQAGAAVDRDMSVARRDIPVIAGARGGFVQREG